MENSKKILVQDQKPKNFVSQAEVAAVYLKVNDEVLYLQRADSERGFWGLPAGVIEKDESPIAAMERELYEETGIDLKDRSQMKFLGKLYMVKPTVHYIFHTYHLQLSDKPLVKLSDEHLDFHWCKLQEVPKMSLMTGALEAFEWYRRVVSSE